MEFKKRLVQRQKARKASHYKESGYQRVVIRGRKRWIKASPKQQPDIPADGGQPEQV